MQVIRLQRVGKKNQPSFRIVLQEKSWAPQGKAQELLGFYDPVNKEKTFQEERITYWMSKGAQPSPTVHNLLVDAGIVEGEKVQAWRPKVKEKDREEKPAEETPEEKEGAAEENGEAQGAQDKAPTENEENEQEESPEDTKEAPEQEEEKEEQPAEDTADKKEEGE